MSSPLNVLVTGASGYIGSRLVPRLLADGHEVRCMTRDPGRLAGRPWAGEVTAVTADASDPAAVDRALAGVDAAYYLIHSMGPGGQFEHRDRIAAQVFAGAARRAGVRRIIYLSGIVPAGDQGLSPHLRSRGEVASLLLDSGVPAAVLQAAVVIGSGSASFEMLRYLTERLPVMVTPAWVRNRIQPISVGNVLHYLAGCLALPPGVNRRFDIGGPDIVTYQEMMHRYAAVAGLHRRVIVGVPLLTPRLSSLWVGLVTPVPPGLARPLVESLRNEVIRAEHDIAEWVPDPPGGLTPLTAAIAQALRGTPAEAAGSPPPAGAAAAGAPAPADALPGDPAWAGGSVYVDERAATVRAPQEALWRLIEGIGGKAGWYSMPAAWAARGLIDRLAGGTGLRPGRPVSGRLHPGDALDFWRVEAVQAPSLLRLRAEMKLPGAAWLELSATRDGAGRTVYRQRAVFRPRGLAGQAYWWSLKPFHGIVFGSMLRNITATAERSPAAR